MNTEIKYLVSHIITTYLCRNVSKNELKRMYEERDIDMLLHIVYQQCWDYIPPKYDTDDFRNAIWKTQDSISA